ncbi:hypothetical protein IQ247_07025 [Plectonema cf. radiosum LEGE 06105]|uniref:Uncharacterized protein n=1 Tax=Plectonema cf. radiosum LEGE 06105 TaxID=945769 RepID=A0A8J7EYJ0_9CYAN|nr:hypothetical protein [Plectonema radiosum]MBE9212466.1 hypothetical protein [Plectonema cf. radiosum LEGE 06105]
MELIIHICVQLPITNQLPIRAAFENGTTTTIDTAEVYRGGHSEKIVAADQFNPDDNRANNQLFQGELSWFSHK